MKDSAAPGLPDPRTLAQLEALVLEPGRPLLVLDCDEVLVEFAGHMMRWLATQGIVMRLERYELEGSMRREGEDVPLPFAECIRWIRAYFAAETANQRLLPGAREAVLRLSRRAEVVVLTNVPHEALEARVENLSAQGLCFPVVENTGGKGRALAWLAERAGSPVIFVDDSADQLESAATHAPEVLRLQFAGAPKVAEVLPRTDVAERVTDWPAAEAWIADRLSP